MFLLGNLAYMKNTPILKEVRINAKPEAIWEALTLPEQMEEWYFEVHDFNLQVDNEFYFFEPGGTNKFRHVCKITEIIPARKFQHTWTFPDFTNGVSVLTWELIPSGEKTLVRLLHEDIENFADAGNDFARANFDAGWEEIVTINLVNYLTKIQ